MPKARFSLGDYLAEPEPVAILWLDLVDEVYRDSPRHAYMERLSPSAQVSFNTGCFFGEIVNGGMSQFFSNSATVHTKHWPHCAGLVRHCASSCLRKH